MSCTLRVLCAICDLLGDVLILLINHEQTEKIHVVFGDCHQEFGDFRSKADLDPGRSIFSRFRRTRARFSSQTLYRTVIESREVDKNNLS